MECNANKGKGLVVDVIKIVTNPQIQGRFNLPPKDMLFER